MAQAERSSLRAEARTRRAGALPWWTGYGPLVLLPALVVALVPASWPRWGLMSVLAVAIFFAVKWLTWRRTPARDVPWWLQLGYLVGWPGLDAVAFLKPPSRERVARPEASEWLFAVAKLAIGIGVLWGLTPFVPAEYPYVAGWVGMTGIAFVMHFGLFHLMSCAWRSAGVDAKPLMNWPMVATSLGDYWGQRWNRAFRDLAHRFLFRPLTPFFGARGAILAGFLFSGIVHDLVVSLPAGGWYGGPTLFFVIQALGLLVEKSALARTWGLGRGWRGWLFTVSLVLGPAVLLFHPPFVLNVVVPFLRAIGAA